jgi:phospholipid/cholesterol/gamma-HCH transport system substrate-binding protein
METRANYALIGLFTLAVVAAAFGFVYWFSGSDSGQRRQPVRVVFSGSVSGLSKGSMVLFNGIRVGEVTDIRLLPEDPRRVVAVTEVDRTTPVRTDTRARLEVNMLSGVAGIALVGGEPGAPVLTPGPGQPLPTIFADRSDFQDVMEMARSLARRADEVLEGLGRIVSENEGTISRTLQNVEGFSRALGENAPGINKFLAQMGQAAERIGPLAEKLEVLTTDATELLRAVDRQRIARIVENVEGFTQGLSENRQNVTNTLTDVASLAKRLNDAAPKLDTALTDVGNVVKAVDPAKISRTVDNVERFSTALEAVDGKRMARVVENVDAFTQALGDNKQNVANILQDTATLTRRLNDTAPKLDMALTDVGNAARAIDPVKLNRTIDNADRFASALGATSEDVQKAIREAASITEKLNRSADRIDGVLKAAENFLGSASGEEGKGTFESIREAADSIRTLANNLDKRTAEITVGINRFTGAGAREIGAAASEARRTLTDVGRTVRSIEKNPSQVIFGGSPSLPEYSGRR